jgi:acyl-CoA reductase-like NAD-dependent aldehyde dehydrogenase
VTLEVVAVARAAAAAWGEASLNRRSQVLFASAAFLNARKEKLASIIIDEHGKLEALGVLVRARASIPGPVAGSHRATDAIRLAHSRRASSGPVRDSCGRADSRCGSATPGPTTWWPVPGGR